MSKSLRATRFSPPTHKQMVCRVATLPVFSNGVETGTGSQETGLGNWNNSSQQGTATAVAL